MRVMQTNAAPSRADTVRLRGGNVPRCRFRPTRRRRYGSWMSTKASLPACPTSGSRAGPSARRSHARNARPAARARSSAATSHQAAAGREAGRRWRKPPARQPLSVNLEAPSDEHVHRLTPTQESPAICCQARVRGRLLAAREACRAAAAPAPRPNRRRGRRERDREILGSWTGSSARRCSITRTQRFQPVGTPPRKSRRDTRGAERASTRPSTLRVRFALHELGSPRRNLISSAIPDAWGARPTPRSFRRVTRAAYERCCACRVWARGGPRARVVESRRTRRCAAGGSTPRRGRGARRAIT